MTGENGEIVIGDVEYDGRVILYVIKGMFFCVLQVPHSTNVPTADETSYINFIKPLIFAEELGFPHLLSVIDTTSQWFYKVHPERMVPSLKDQDPETKEEIIVFEGTACLQYLADRFDHDGAWTGRTAFEKGNVYAWTAYQTAGIGATAKYWLYFKRGYPTRKNPIELPRTIEKYESCAYLRSHANLEQTTCKYCEAVGYLGEASITPWSTVHCTEGSSNYC